MFANNDNEATQAFFSVFIIAFFAFDSGSPFAYLEPAFRKKQAVGRLYSPVIPAGERCFTFSYLRYGADIGYLKLDMEARHKRVNYIDWQGGDMVRKWAKTSIDLTSEDNYQVNCDLLLQKQLDEE